MKAERLSTRRGLVLLVVLGFLAAGVSLAPLEALQSICVECASLLNQEECVHVYSLEWGFQSCKVISENCVSWSSCISD